MCGLAGIYDATRMASDADVKKMISAIHYRGVDESDVVDLGECILGHARLAVVDPENGMQPMSNSDNSVWVVFNGEIYNFVELRNSLIEKGYKFKSRCDTEVLVHLWSEYGEKMITMLNGMFTFFLWDKENKLGMLARDRQGIKPCYYWNKDGKLAFASEIKALFELPFIEKNINDTGLSLMHSFNYCPPPATCYEEIFHLEPGHYFLVKGTGEFELKKYWEWPLFETRDGSFDEFEELLQDAIKMQMRFDVDGCMFLSGGVDSSILAHELRKQWNRDSIKAYTLDCTVDGFGERYLAEHVASNASLGIDLVSVEYGPDDVKNNIEKVIYHSDQPHGDFSFHLIRQLCQAAHNDGNIVAFTGDGPDEAMLGFSHNEVFFQNQTRSTFPLKAYFEKNKILQAKLTKDGVIKFSKDIQVDHSYAYFEKALSNFRELEPATQISAYELTKLMPGNNLIKGDRMGAGLSIEGRSPFMDFRVSEYLARLPLTSKLKNGKGKDFLKSYGLRYFDESHMYRKKSMPTMPIGEWLKGPLLKWEKIS